MGVRKMRSHFSLIFRGAYVLLSGGALLSWLGITGDNGTLEDIVFYTTQSNLLCYVFFLWYFIYGIAKSDNNAPANPAPRIKGAITLSILVTGIIFVVLPGPSYVGAASKILHYVCPIMVLMDYLLFDVKGKYRRFEPFLWLVIPMAYVIFSQLRGAYGGNITGTESSYPYPFLDPTPAGAGSGMILYVGIMLAGFLMLGYVIFMIDRAMSKKNIS
jgi:energy-converting hydrogenase Eha subunit C